MAGRQTLDLAIKVRILVPEPTSLIRRGAEKLNSDGLSSDALAPRSGERVRERGDGPMV
jgi:hypothetical protein